MEAPSEDIERLEQGKDNTTLGTPVCIIAGYAPFSKHTEFSWYINH